MMIAEQRINNCSLSRMMVVCSSIMVFCLVVLLFNRKVFAFVQTKELYQIVFCDWLWRCIGSRTPVSPKLLELNNICHKSVSLICYNFKYSYCADVQHVSIICRFVGWKLNTAHKIPHLIASRGFWFGDRALTPSHQISPSFHLPSS